MSTDDFLSVIELSQLLATHVVGALDLQSRTYLRLMWADIMSYLHVLAWDGILGVGIPAAEDRGVSM